MLQFSVCLFGLMLMQSRGIRSDPPDEEHDMPFAAFSSIRDDAIGPRFDCTTKWPECKALLEEVPQMSARCHDCYAHAMAAMTASRMCIHSAGAHQIALSAFAITQCAGKKDGSGCTGGSSQKACTYYERNHPISGSTSIYRKQGCRPYPYPVCVPGKEEPVCPRDKHLFYPWTCNDASCEDPSMAIEKEQFPSPKCASVHHKDPKEKVREIQRAIMDSGPVAADMFVTQEFKDYKSGIITDTRAHPPPDHVVQLVGWDVDEQTKQEYWIGRNSWGTAWGMSGTFFIERNKNILHIETTIIYGRITKTSDTAPISTILHRNLTAQGEEKECVSIEMVRACPVGHVAVLLEERHISFACFTPGTEEAVFARRNSPRITSLSQYDYLGITEKITLPVLCIDPQ